MFGNNSFPAQTTYELSVSGLGLACKVRNVSHLYNTLQVISYLMWSSHHTPVMSKTGHPECDPNNPKAGGPMDLG